MSTTAEPEIRFTADSLEFRDAVQRRLAEKICEIVVRRTQQKAKAVITKEDVRASLREAAQQVFQELELEAATP